MMVSWNFMGWIPSGKPTWLWKITTIVLKCPKSLLLSSGHLTVRYRKWPLESSVFPVKKWWCSLIFYDSVSLPEDTYMEAMYQFEYLSPNGNFPWLVYWITWCLKTWLNWFHQLTSRCLTAGERGYIPLWHSTNSMDWAFAFPDSSVGSKKYPPA